MRVLYNKVVKSAIPFRGLVPNRLSLMFSDSNSPEKRGSALPVLSVPAGRFLVACAPKTKGAPDGAPFVLNTRAYRAGLWPRLVGARGARRARPREIFHRTCR